MHQVGSFRKVGLASLLRLLHGITELCVGVILFQLTVDIHDFLIPRREGG